MIELVICVGCLPLLAAAVGSDPPMWVASMDAVLSRWFTTYEEARASLEANGGYLFP